MASPSAMLLSLCCMLSFSLCSGMTLGRGLSNCPCLKWSEVYGPGGIDCNPGIGGLAGGEFCGFMQKLHSNVCVEKDFMTRGGVTDSVCYVSAECAGTEQMKRKTCTSGTDTLLTEMSVAQTTRLARTHGVDQGCMAAYAGIYVDKLFNEVSKEEIDLYQARGEHTFIWSMRDHLGPRLEIKGKEVYKHVFNISTPGYWDVSCIEGC
mmetsp:Transcript_47826/g.96492  ORF Transcript_47826/g.96492 Transcript_47826/m.96492 type:complete len:207 (-) Transcript_47826:110-730(-)